MELIKQLQTVVAPQIFTPRAVYDGRKNMFTIHDLPFGSTGSREVQCSCLYSPNAFFNAISIV